jgi:hypothetical protein
MENHSSWSFVSVKKPFRSSRRSRKTNNSLSAAGCLSEGDAGAGTSSCSQEFLVPFFDKKETYKN